MSNKKGRRAKYSGSLEKHGRVFRARWVIDGCTYTRSTGCLLSQRKEAEAKLKEFMAPFIAQHDKDRIEELKLQIQRKKGDIEAYVETLPSMPLLCAFGAYRKTPKGKKASKETVKMYESQFNYFIDWMKTHYPEIKEVRRITRQIAREFLASIENEYSANTHNKYRGLLLAMWNELKEQDEIVAESVSNCFCKEESVKYSRISINPWEAVPRVSTVDKSVSRRELTVEELAKVVAHLEGEMRGLFAIGIYTGLRLADCALLKWETVDVIRGIIHAEPHKTKNKTAAKIDIPIHPVLEQILVETPSEKRNGYVLPESAAAYLRNRGEFCKVVNKVFDECGIERQTREYNRARPLVGFHSLRHTFVSLSAAKGAPIEMVRQLVGHGNPSMTRHYLHANDESLRSVVDSLPNVIDVDVKTGLIDQFKAVVMKMDEAQRVEARRWLCDLGNQSVAA